MKVRFYPRDIGMFRQTGDFDFTGSITLSTTRKERFKEFSDRSELIDYLTDLGVRLDDYEYPLTFTKEPSTMCGEYSFTVHQWSTLGWMIEL